MEKDSVPELLGKIQKEFNKSIARNKTLLHEMELLKQKKATYKNANKYALELGKELSQILQKHITVDTLPDGKMYFNIADRILRETLGENYNLVKDYTSVVQKQLNKQTKISLKVIQPEMNESRVKGLIEKIVHEEDFEKASWLLGDSIENFTQSIVDDFAKQNIAFHGKSGLSPKLRRTVIGNCCDWCEQKAGLYNYPVPDDVYLRHRKCDCLVEYFPGNGKVQNSHTKQWSSIDSAKQENRKEIDRKVEYKDLPYRSVKAEWLKNYQKPIVRDAEYWEYEGVKYFVDGKNVILDYSKREKEVAHLISDKFGVEVILNPKIQNPKNIPSPDYLINGIGYDLKEITKVGKNNVDTAIKSGKKQARNFVLDYTKSGLSREDIDSRLNRLYQNPHRKWVENIILIKDGKVEDVIKK